MKFTAFQKTFRDCLTVVGRAIPQKPTRPVLANVLVKVDKDSQLVTLAGFDESLAIETSFDALVDASGCLTLPAKILGDIVSRLPATEEITIEQDESRPVVKLTCSAGEYQILGLDAENYPILPLVESGHSGELSAKDLLKGVQGSLFATSSDESKLLLTGVHLASETATFDFVGLDGHRLVVASIETEAFAGTGMSITVPARALKELEKMIRTHAPDELVGIAFDAAQVCFDLGRQRLTSCLLIGTYPAYQQLIPKDFVRQTTVDRKRLISGLERVAVLARQDKNLIELAIDADQGSLTLSVEAREIGGGREELPIQVAGEDLVIGFNVNYLLDGLKSFDCDEVQLQWSIPTSPVVFMPLGEMRATYLVMPINLRK